MAEAVLGLGANLGARRAAFGAAAALLAALPACRVLARSRLYETPALGPPQPDYLNAALRVQWQGEAVDLLAAAQRVEALLGRERRVRWGPRTLDIDMLYWSEGPVQCAGLMVPHPELEARAFALAPLLDVAPELAQRWQPQLARLGGAPKPASPGWPSFRREGAHVCSGWTRDASELASQLGDLLAHAASGGRRVRAHHTRALRGPAEARASAREQDNEARASAREQNNEARASPCAGDVAHVTKAASFCSPAQPRTATAHAREPERELAPERWLAAAIAAAWRGGFGVRCAVVNACGATELSGVLVGEEGLEARSARLPAVQVERRDDGERRLRMALGASEDGFDFGGSATMSRLE